MSIISRCGAGRLTYPSRAMVGLLSFSCLLCGQSGPPTQNPTLDKPAEHSGTVIRSNVREVLLDVVVRRKDLTLAKKLKASDLK
jgi:hypothetical protein